MNRKERRASIKHAARTAPPGASTPLPQISAVEDLFAAAAAHHRKGDLATAQGLCRTILARDPKHLRSLILLGIIAQANGRPKLAVKLFGLVLALDPEIAIAHDGIASAYQALGRQDETMRHFTNAIELGLHDVETLVKQRTSVSAALKDLAAAWPRHLPLADLLADRGSGPLAAEGLLLALLQTKIVCDLDLERLLTAIRRGLLLHVIEDSPGSTEIDALDLFCALAQQCFVNDYVFALDEVERSQLQQVRNRIVKAIKAGAEIAPLDLVAAAAYLPLYKLPQASSLLHKPWPGAVTALLKQQIGEPLEEESDRGVIPALTSIDDSVSLQVQNQYEENPYPRWTILPPIRPTTISAYVRDKIGIALQDGPATGAVVDILIAGCGTGSHSIDTAQRFPQSRVLAVDISRASLAYARRKTRALGLANIEYGQADILNLGSIARRFDVTEVVGVLHHLADPAAGWRVLLSLLRPKGLMLVGLYSAAARREVTAVRAFIAERGYRATADDIRACRQDIIRHGRAARTDAFFSISGCRDLLFNVMEHQFTIPQIATFLEANDLTFLGFQLPPEALAQFQQRFPDPAALRDLAAWNAFEQEAPFTFQRMYYFWVQKREPH